MDCITSFTIWYSGSTISTSVEWERKVRKLITWQKQLDVKLDEVNCLLELHASFKYDQISSRNAKETQKLCFQVLSQSTIKCSKLTIETLEQDVKYVQS